MRTIESTWSATDADLTPEHAEKLLTALDTAGDTERATTARDDHGLPGAGVELVSFTGPLGKTRWAVTMWSPDGREVTDSADQAEAEAHYEAEVRQQSAIEDFHGPAWHDSDVKGIPLAPYTYTFAYRAEGQWLEPAEHAAVLGLPTMDGLIDRCDLTELEGAAEVLARVAADRQQDVNHTFACARAAGYPQLAGPVYDAVRITVSGTAATGPFEEAAEQILPAPRPAPDEIAGFADSMRRAEDDSDLSQDLTAY
jgi:hypothetical protein